MTACHHTIGGTSVETKLGGKTALLTGATSGIGKRTAIGLGALGATVVVVARDRERGRIVQQEIRRESGNDAVELLVADLTAQRNVRALAAEFRERHDRLHLLVHATGARFGARGLTEDRLERTFALNYLAAFQLTNLLLDELRAGAPSRVLNVVSRVPRGVHLDLDDLQGERDYVPARAHAQSTLATILWTYELASRLDGTGVTVNCVEQGRRRSRRAARTLLRVATAPELEAVSAECFSTSGVEKRTRNETYDPALAAQLWEASERLVGALVPA
jgi:NAD(P)-dependent dehydrogenase (short-subunit alcohol dehydrogenase family)